MNYPKTTPPMTPAEYREIRQSLGLTQRELAERLGVDPQTISRRERGELPILREAVLAIRAVSHARLRRKAASWDASCHDDVIL